ncbi:MAG: hypothetical protein K2X91_16885 [Thermoleophilia bacterium]|nr:hypothetical protein [Thermoleophilia bacterium]
MRRWRGLLRGALTAASLAALTAWAWGAFGEPLDEPRNSGFLVDVATLVSACPGSRQPPSPREARRALSAVERIVGERPGARVVLDESGDRPGAPVGDSVADVAARLADRLETCGLREMARRLRDAGA